MASLNQRALTRAESAFGNLAGSPAPESYDRAWATVREALTMHPFEDAMDQLTKVAGPFPRKGVAMLVGRVVDALDTSWLLSQAGVVDD
jgi:hypothetical protein